MSKAKLIKRLQWYYPTERFNAYLFTSVIVYVAYNYPLSHSIFLIYGLVLMTFILFQGQHYWKLKLYRLTNKSFNEERNLKLFRITKKLNVLLIILIPIVFALQWTINKEKNAENELLLWGILANLVGMLEHINYYHRQLMIDNLADLKYLIRHKKLKIASLKKDIDEDRI
ncbi:MAG: hypothetical protein SFU27_00820 [Thermonemataceae bacterium]|nr:hypothetical protein [Thermonemataceae bacterium]